MRLSPVIHAWRRRTIEQDTHPSSSAARARVDRRACALLAFLLPLATVARAEDVLAQVRAAFARYVAAVAARDGAAAVGLVTPASLAHQERLRDLALVAPREQLAALPPADRLMVLRLRHEFTAAELRPLSGADLIRIGVEEAWSSPKVLAPLAITAVDETGDLATARVERAGELVPIRLLFRRDAGGWRLDLVELARGSDAALAETLAFRACRAKVPVEEVLRWVIEDTSGHLVDKDLWVPLEPGSE